MKDQHIQSYTRNLIELVSSKISKDITDEKIQHVLNEHLLFHIKDTNSSRFQQFYFETVDNEEHYFSTDTFFKVFKRQYSLQAIDNGLLQKLETSKKEILLLIKEDELYELYKKYFYQVRVKHGNNTISKDLSSFFSKLVHTFRPKDYCALDNPIKEYLGLRKESFFISFFVISASYKSWSFDHPTMIGKIRKEFQELDAKKTMQFEKLSNLKLLDLIFWSKANRP